MSDELEDESKNNGIERNLGVQPIDACMTERGLANHDLVGAISEPLTHKAVQRARKGRLLKQNMQRRIVAAFNAAVKARGEEHVFTVPELFTYKGKP